MNIIVHFSVSEGAGIDAHGPVIGVQDKCALGERKIHLPHHKVVVDVYKRQVSYWVCSGMSALLYCPSESMVPFTGYPSVSDVYKRQINTVPGKAQHFANA